MRIQRWMGAALVVGTAAVAGAGGVAAASSPDDDLAVVKKATSAAGRAAGTAPTARVAASARTVPTPPPPRGEPEPPADDVDAIERREREVMERDSAPPRMRRGSGREPRWFRVRVIEHGRKGGGVTVNLPIGIARALGDEFPIELGCRHRHGSRGKSCPTLRLGDVLRTLASGEDLVAIDDDDTTVRIWVE